MANFLLNKGGAGVSISRQETVERLNPVIKKHYALLHAYDHAVRHVGSRDVAARLEAHQKTTRADIGKLAESVLSAGGVPYNGIDLEAADFDLGTDEDGIFARLHELERDFLDTVTAEFDLKHQIRTQAILTNVQTHSQERLNLLDELTRSRPRREAPASS